MTSLVTRLPTAGDVQPIRVMTLWTNPQRTYQTIRCPAHRPADRDGWTTRTLTLDWNCEVCLLARS